MKTTKQETPALGLEKGRFESLLPAVKLDPYYLVTTALGTLGFELVFSKGVTLKFWCEEKTAKCECLDFRNFGGPFSALCGNAPLDAEAPDVHSAMIPALPAFKMELLRLIAGKTVQLREAFTDPSKVEPHLAKLAALLDPQRCNWDSQFKNDLGLWVTATTPDATTLQWYEAINLMEVMETLPADLKEAAPTVTVPNSHPLIAALLSVSHGAITPGMNFTMQVVRDSVTLEALAFRDVQLEEPSLEEPDIMVQLRGHGNISFNGNLASEFKIFESEQAALAYAANVTRPTLQRPMPYDSNIVTGGHHMPFGKLKSPIAPRDHSFFERLGLSKMR